MTIATLPWAWPRVLFTCGTCALSVGQSLPALAQQTDDGFAVSPTPEAERTRRDHVVVGMGTMILPQFQGSRDFKVQPALVIDIEQGRFFAKAGEGIGLYLINKDKLQAGVSVTWMLGYHRKDVPEGIGRLRDTFGGRAFVTGQVAGFTGNLSVTSPIVGGDAEGVIINARLSRPVRLGDKVTLSPGIGVSWADAKHLRRHFGVNDPQSIASGLSTYRPSSGFKDADVRMAVNYRLTQRVNLVGVGMLVRNFDRVTDSPFNQRGWSPMAVVGFGYTF